MAGALHQVSTMIPVTRSTCTRAVTAALHSLSIVVPPVGRAMLVALCQPVAPRFHSVRLLPTATRDPCGSVANRHPALVHSASACAFPVHSPVGAAPTNQHCPGAGAAGGAFCSTDSATGNSSASIKVNASLWVISFCACPATSNGKAKRAVVNESGISISLMINSDCDGQSQGRRVARFASLANCDSDMRRHRAPLGYAHR